ncbi:MAG TPA: M1 family metallopeptidase [Bacteroidales bacterium]|nr:M1 family metallopeptidase [Bacteroidales bacterium]HSA43903.1 M1 family metallopeptidase [Bacteroidales bacterium]
MVGFRVFFFLVMSGLLLQGRGWAAPWIQTATDSADILHYEIHLDITNIQGKIITGHTRLLLTAREPSVSGLDLELLKLNVDSVKLGQADLPFQYNDTTISLVFPLPLTMADTVEIFVFYHGTPEVESGGWGGFHFSGSNLAYNLGIALVDVPHNYGRAWFPCIDNFTERATFDFYITVTDPFIAVCNGSLAGVYPQGGNTSMYHWGLDIPVPAYLASVAVSSYSCVQSTYPGIAGNIPVTLYVKPGDTTKAKNSFININTVLATFEQCFGPYRWNRVGYVSTPIGAMEHATNIAYPQSCIDGTLAWEWLYAHELSHMWFGDYVTCHSAGDMWINEGWAVFCEGVFKEGVYGQQAYKDYVRAKQHDVLQNTHHTDGGFYALYNIPQNLTYGSTVYDKGGLVVNTLRGYLGDSLFFATVQQYLDSFACRDISSQQMRDLFSGLSGVDLTDFFETWVFHPGFPHFSIDSVRVVPSGNQYETKVYLRQKQKGTTHISNGNLLELDFISQDLTVETRTMTFNGQLGEITCLLPFQPKAVLLDAREKIADASTDYLRTISNNGSYTFPDTYCSLEVLSCPAPAMLQVTHHWVAPDTLEQPVPGFTLSPQRYWSIDGVTPSGFDAKLAFSYSRFGHLDHELIINQADSLVMMYRPGPGYPWQGIPFVMNGSTFQGQIMIDTLRTGEYALGIWDYYFIGIREAETSQMLEVSPNPGKDLLQVVIHVSESAKLKVYSAGGQLVDSLDTPAGYTVLPWKPRQQMAGVLFFRLESRNGKLLAVKKAVLN